MTDAIRIRRAFAPDLPYFYEICLKTGNAGKDAASLFNDPFLLGHYFAAPYLFYPQGIAFTAEEDCRPSGYSIAACDTTDFNRWMEAEWLPPLRKLFPVFVPPGRIRSRDEGGLFQSIHSTHFPPETAWPWLAEYPAHLHINLLPQAQGRGIGRLLIKKLCAELSRRGIPGVHLGVNGKNTGAIAFYHKTGFSFLQTEEWGMIMGKKL
jgi:GNAT superfamily N-acetyltransferase